MARLVRLTPDASIKMLEEPCLYNRRTDELYEVSVEAIDFLKECVRGTSAPRDGEAAAFVEYCLKEGLLDAVSDPVDRKMQIWHTPLPSLRYLLLHITERCNLECRHCFQGEAGTLDLPLTGIAAIIDEFEKMQGLRLMVSGGEPLLHRNFWELNDLVGQRDLRSILLSNGMLIDSEAARRIRFQAVQVSLDGMRQAHERLRGPGSYDPALRSIRLLTDAGVQVSVATMIHPANIGDFEEMARLVRDLGVSEWSIDLPSRAGRLERSSELLTDPGTAGPMLDYAFGGAIHNPAPGLACGAHLMAVMANGDVARCGLYADRPVGTVKEGLAACWIRLKPTPLAELECDCDLVEDCRGGCRFRAAGYNNEYGPDLCQCYRYGIVK